MKCREARGLLVALSNDEVTRSERLLTQAHLAGCAACRAEYEAMAEVRRRLKAGLAARGSLAAPTGQAWAGIQARLAPRPRGIARAWFAPASRPASRLASAAVMAVALFAASFALNPLTRGRQVPEVATATPQHAPAQPAATATPDILPGAANSLGTLTADEMRREQAMDRADAASRNRHPLAAAVRPPRREADRFDMIDTTDALDGEPAIEETQTPCEACHPLN